MRKIVFIVIGLLLGGVVFGQNAYQDAKKLLGYLEIKVTDGKVIFSDPISENLESIKFITNILKNYPTLDQNNQINPYIVYKFPSGSKKPETNVEPQEKSTAKGLSIPMIADGVAKFLVQRVKEELAVAFFERFAAKIKENIVLANLFPRTANALAAMSEEIYMFSSYIELLREAMRSDVKEIWARLPIFLERPEVEIYLKNKLKVKNIDKIKNLIAAASFLMDGLVKEKHVGVILEELQDAKLDEMFNAIWDETINPYTANNIKTLLKLAREISRSLKSEDAKSYWVDWKEFETQFQKDEKFRLLYLGLLYQRIKCFSLEFDKTKIPISEIFSTSAKAQRCITYLALAFRDLELSIKQIENSGEKTSAGIYEYAEAYIKIFEKGLTLIDEMDLTQELIKASPSANQNELMIKTQGLHASLIKFRTQAQYYLTLARSLKNVFVGVSQKDYSMALMNVVNVWNPLMEVLKSMDSDNNNIAAVQAEINSVLYKYGSFIAAVSKAENSDDVKKAIETIALPSGSYSMKRNSNFTLSLSGYVGLSGGWEMFRKKGVEELQRGMVSICAPIGIDLVWGNYEGWISSLGLFVSIVDLGALVAYRFKDDLGEIPEFSLKNILCPGAHIVYGFKKIPITVGIGCKFGPQLRKIELDPQTNQVLKDIQTNSFRFELFIGVDIPLLNFICK